MDKEIKEQIVKYSKELRLPIFRSTFEGQAVQAAKDSLSYEQYLLSLMEQEYHMRLENRKKANIRQAGFPQKHYLHELQKALLPESAQKKLPLLERLDFIKEGQNIVLAGNPGTGGRLPGRHILLPPWPPRQWVSKPVKRDIKYCLRPYPD